MEQKVTILKCDFEKNRIFWKKNEILFWETTFFVPTWKTLLNKLVVLYVKFVINCFDFQFRIACRPCWQGNVKETHRAELMIFHIKKVNGECSSSYYQVETITMYQMTFIRQSVKLQRYRFYFFLANGSWLTDWAKLIARVNLNDTSLLFTSSVFTFPRPSR